MDGHLILYSHIGPFIFTKALLPLMAETARLPGADVRIIVVHQHPRILKPKGSSNCVDGTIPDDFDSNEHREGL